VEEVTFQPGDLTIFASDSFVEPYSAFFEDDGDTGYFYACDRLRADDSIVDAVHIYNVANVTDRQKPSTLIIVWSEDCLKCALLINRYPHAIFDFAAKRGYCRTNYPNFRAHDGKWAGEDHSWSDEAMQSFN
jgi:hypothetical protein